MQNFLKTCNIFSKWDWEFRWFTTEFSLLNLNSFYRIMWFLILHGCHGLSFAQSFPVKPDPDKAGLLSARTLSEGAEVAVMSQDPSCQAGGSTQATAHPLGLRQRGCHEGSHLMLAQQSSQQTRLLHPVTSSTFCIKQSSVSWACMFLQV